MFLVADFAFSTQGIWFKCKSPCNFGLSVEISSYGNVDNNTVAGVISNGLLYIPINAMFNTYIQCCIITHNSKSRSQNLEQLRAQRSKSKPKTQLPELVYVGLCKDAQSHAEQGYIWTSMNYVDFFLMGYEHL